MDASIGFVYVVFCTEYGFVWVVEPYTVDFVEEAGEGKAIHGWGDFVFPYSLVDGGLLFLFV